MSTPKTLWIHVGPPKTGTSAIQNLFRDLDDPALTYPKNGQWPDGSHNLIPFSLRRIERYGAIDVPPREALFPKIRAELRRAKGDALISTEGLAQPQVFQRFTNAFANVIAEFDRVVPILTLRHPIERAASDYNQIVKDPEQGYAKLPDDFLAERIGSHRLVPFVRAWTNAAADPVILPYHPADDLVARFCAAIGRPDLAPEKAEWRNRSLGGLGLALILLGNRLHETRDARSDYFSMIRSQGLRLWRGGSFPFSPQAVSAASSSVINRDLQVLKDVHGIDLGSWSAPAAVSLTPEEEVKIMELSTTLFPDHPKATSEAQTIIDAFAKSAGAA